MSQFASVCSAYASQVSQYASIVSVQAQGLNSRFIGAEYNISTFSALGSLLVSVSLNGIYKCEWDLLISCAASATVSVQLNGPTLTHAGIQGIMGGSLTGNINTSTAIGNLNAFGTICQTALNVAGVHMCHVEGLFVVGGNGNIGIAPGIATGSIIQIKAGSMVRAWRIGG